MKKIAVVFPGQGSQRPGMACDFYQNFTAAKEVFKVASATLGVDVLELCSSERVLTQTELMQPAILTAEIAMFNVLEELISEKPAYFAGHSLGEYTALVAAGVIPFVDALKIVQGRGELMQSAVAEGSGTMAALICQEIENTDYRKIIENAGAEVANFNSPNQVVISGMNESIASCIEKLESLYPEMRCIRLDVSMPFHCSLMSRVEVELEKYLRVFEARMQPSKAAVVLSNLQGGFYKPEDLIPNLVKQISGCVHWTKNIESLMAVSDEVIEIGPNKVLGRLFKDSGFPIKSILNLKSLHRTLASMVDDTRAASGLVANLA